MIRRARMQFIVTASISVAVILLTVIGVINGTMRGMVQMQTRGVLHALSEWQSDGETQQFYPVSGTMLTNHFIRVTVSADCTQMTVEMARMLSLEESDTEALVSQAQATGRTTGVIWKDGADYAFQITDLGEDGSRIVFVDCTAAVIMMAQLMQASLTVGAVAFASFVVIISLLSRRAIRPVIRNMENQKRFITNAGHELKTPLAIISANAEVLEAVHGENEWTLSIRTQVERLTALVGKLIALSKLGEQERVELTPVDLSKLTTQSAQSFLPLAEQQGKQLQWQVAEQVRVRGEERLLSELESILLDNAIKYCDSAGTISLTLSAAEGSAVLAVSNDYADGAGVDYSRFFERFYQQDQSHNKGGFGIGLSMAQEIVRALKGSIRVEYHSGRITFRVTFSVAKGQ